MSDTNTITCPCGFDSGKTLKGIHGTIGHQKTHLGMFWLPVSDGGALWICLKCAESCQKLTQQVCDLIKSDEWRPTSFGVKYEEKGKSE